MKKALNRWLILEGLVIVGAFIAWTRPSQRPQRLESESVVSTVAPISPSARETAKPTKPAAMDHPGTYAAVRLKEIKADPAKWREPWPWRQEFGSADTPELQREVLGLARQVGSDSVLFVLALALASDDPLVRLDAVHAIALLSEERMRDGFAIGTYAADPEIREEVMDLVLQVQPHLRAELLRVALAAGKADVQARVLDLITDFPSPEFFTVLIEGLRMASPDVQPSFQQAISDMVEQRFANYDEARAWWAGNRENYDNLMSRIP